MSYSKSVKALLVDLEKIEFEEISTPDSEGLLLSLTLYNKEEGKDLVISSSSLESYYSVGSSVYSIVFTSPFTKSVDFTYDTFAFGLALSLLGYKALVIKGKAKKSVYLHLYSNEKKIESAESFKNVSLDEFEKSVKKNPFDLTLFAPSSSDYGVKISSLRSGFINLEGQGLGYAFKEKNLKGIVLQGFLKTDFENRVKSKSRKKLEKRPFSRSLRRYGNLNFITPGTKSSWVPVSSFSSSFDPRVINLDGLSSFENFGNYPFSCLDCYLSCYRCKKNGERLPSFKEAMNLGSNLGFFDLRDVAKISKVVNDEGLGVSQVGSILAYLFSLNEDDRKMFGLKEKSVDEVITFIKNLSSNSGAASLFRDGVSSLNSEIKSERGKALEFDIRGNESYGVLLSLELDVFLSFSTLKPLNPISEKAASISSSYELLFTLGLLSIGYCPLVCYALNFSFFPKEIFYAPFLYKKVLENVKVLSYKGIDLIEKGFEVFEKLNLTPRKIPEYFIINPNYRNKRVHFHSLILKWNHQMLLLEKKLKSINLKRVKKDSKRRAAVGPSELLGRDGDPGFKK